MVCEGSDLELPIDGVGTPATRIGTWETVRQDGGALATVHQARAAKCCEILFSDGLKPIEIHRRMSIQYGDRCMSRTQVYKWTENFKNGVTTVEDSPRPGPAFTAVTEDNIAAVENVVWENRHVTVKEVALVLDQPTTSFMTC